MISINITTSTDSEVIGHKIFHKNLIYFGKDNGDILINEPNIIDNHMTLEINEYGTFVYTHKDIDHFHLNGKRTNGVINVNINDQIRLSSTTFVLTEVKLDIYEDKNSIINKNLNELINTNAKELEILTILEEELKKNS